MLTVNDVMTREVFAVAPDTSLVTAARLFSEKRISGAPVLDREGKPIGVVTQRDLIDPDRDRTATAGESRYYRVSEHTATIRWDDATAPEGVVGDVMSPFVLAVAGTTALIDAARLMAHDGVHRLLVLHEGRLCGIVSTMDVVRAVGRYGAEMVR
jgi:CBS domain-containing protein